MKKKHDQTRQKKLISERQTNTFMPQISYISEKIM